MICSLDGETALHRCVRNPTTEAAECLKILLSSGADTEVKNESGSTALHSACEAGNIICVQILLQNGAQVNAVDEEGNSPLHIACSAGFAALSKQLIAFGASNTLKNQMGQSPLDLAMLRIQKVEKWLQR